MKDSNFLKENNGRFMWHPMTSPKDSIDQPPKIITGSNGVTITDIDGHNVVDAVGGLWNVNLGYSCQPVKDAIAAQLDALPYYSTFRGTSNDAAIARQYHKLRGEAGRTKFLSLKKGYHGTHIGGASVNGNANFRNAYEPLLPGCFHIPAPYTYRNPFNETDPAKLAQLCVAALEDEIAFQGANTIAAMIMEPILGAGGVIPPHESFAPLVQEVCNRNGILLITDEVITGYGRTGAWSGARLWGVQPDMMATAKAITNGYFPFGALMLGHRMAEVFEDNPDAKIGHGYTYSGHPGQGADGEVRHRRRCARWPRPDDRAGTGQRPRDKSADWRRHRDYRSGNWLSERRDGARLWPERDPVAATCTDGRRSRYNPVRPRCWLGRCNGRSMTQDYAALLGTKGGPAIRPGSSMPTSNLLCIDGQQIVVDCGLGVTKGLVDQGMQLRDLSLIFISHMHSDHYLELGPLIHTAWTAGLKTPVVIYGPDGIAAYWQNFLLSMKADIDLRIADEGRPSLADLVTINVIDAGHVMDTGGITVTAIRTEHPPLIDTFALSFKTDKTHVVFSGDGADR